MATPFSDDSPPPPPLQTTTKSNLPMLYYGLIVVGTAAVVLALYNIIVIRWCTAGRRSQLSTSGPNSPFGAIEVPTTRTASFRGRFENRGIPSSFKYKKERDSGAGAGGDSECAVCLSAFEEGEEIRKLPRCKHCFHAPCIDMWLYSHSDCPLCRTTVIAAAGRCQRHVTSPPEENSREVLLNSRSIPV